MAQKFAPALLDRYLARTGFDSQQTNQEVPVGSRPDNLFEPVDGPEGRTMVRTASSTTALTSGAGSSGRRITRRSPAGSRPVPPWRAA